MKMTLTALTPIHIRGERSAVLSPVTDYAVIGERLYLLSREKLQERFAARRLLPHFMRQFADEGASFSMTRYMQHWRIQPEDVADRVLRCGREKPSGPILRMERTAGHSYVPGSTLKGAIRTVLAQKSLLEESAVGAESVLDALGSNARFAFEASSLNSRLLGDKRGDMGHFLLVSDSRPFPTDSAGVACVGRVSVKGKLAGPTDWREVVCEQASTEARLDFRWNAEAAKLPPALAFLADFPPMAAEELCRVLNDWARVACERERAWFANVPKIATLYESLLAEIDACEIGQAVLRLGFGKPVLDQTVLEQVMDGQPPGTKEKMLKNLDASVWHRKRRDSKIFPASRVVVLEGGEPVAVLGWAKLSVELM